MMSNGRSAPGSLDLPERSTWSVRPDGQVPPSGRELVVVVPPESPVGPGYDLAREHLRRGAPSVRLVARGVTLADRWPDWVATSQDLTLTEIDAYLPSGKAVLTEEMASELASWLREVFDDAVEGVPAERALWASASLRLFLPAFVGWPLCRGIAQHHATDHVLCTDPDWICADALAAAMRAVGGDVSFTHERRAHPAYRLRTAAWGIASAAGALGYRALEFWRERPSREKLRTLRADATGRPRVWLGVVGDWPRSCRHVVEGVGRAARERGEAVGVILHVSLQPGLRREDDMHGRVGTDVFPSLDAEAIAGNVAAVDQCASVETVGDLLAVGASAVRRMVPIVARLARYGRHLQLGGFPLDLGAHIPALARLATVDVLRGNEAARAARAVATRHDVSRAHVVWPHASLTTMVVPDLVLQAAGATTYDLVHGSLYDNMDMVTFEKTFSSVKVLWTEAEARSYARFTAHQRSVGGYLPRRRPAARRPVRPRAPNEPIRVLALTNYVCSDPDARGPLPVVECFQRAFFAALSAAVAGAEKPLSIRWRPHPSDSRRAVRALADANASLGMSLSLEADALAEDLAWADVLITSISSSISEALLHPIPILVHQTPILDDEGVISFFDRARRFRDPAELTAALRATLRALEVRDPAALAPEDALARSLYGEQRAPRSLADLLWSARCEAMVSAPSPSP